MNDWSASRGAASTADESKRGRVAAKGAEPDSIEFVHSTFVMPDLIRHPPFFQCRP
jgi:hypothetical protein